MLKKFNVFALALLIIGQTILGPIGTSVAFADEPEESNDVNDAFTQPAADTSDEGDTEEVSKDALKTLLDNKKAAEDYEEASYAAYLQVVVEGQEVYDNDNATQEDVNTAVDKIERAIVALQQKISTSTEGDDGDTGSSADDEEDKEGDNQDSTIEITSGFVTLAATGNPISDADMNIQNLEIGRKGGASTTGSSGNFPLDITTGNFSDIYYVKFNFSLGIGHTVQPGDYYTFTVPTAFALTPTTEPRALEGGFATYSIKANGEITITFNEEVLNEGGGAVPIDNGEFDAGWALAAEAKSGDLVQEYPFDINGSKTFTLAVENPGGQTIVKSKIDGHGNNPKTVKWQVDVNTNTNDISSLSLVDSLTVVPGSIEVIELEPQINGTATPKLAAATGYTLTGGNNFPITFDNSGKAYRITYETEVINPTPGSSNISNTATLDGTGGGSSTANHSVYFDEPIKKSVANSVTYPDGTLQWTVEVNADGRDISGGVTVIDKLTLPASTNSADENLMDFDVNSVNFDPAVTNEIIQVNGDELTIYFEPNAGNEETYTITYNTFDTVIDKDYVFTNEAVLTYEDYTDEYETGAKIGTVNHKMLTKVGQTGDEINYLAKTIDWTVTFNTSGYDAINPVVFTDTFDSDDKYFRMYEDEFPTVSGFDLELTDAQNDGGRSYTSTGFTLTATGPVDSQVTFTYPTHFDSTVDYTNNQIKNDVGVVWEKNGQEYSNEDSSTSTFNTFTANNGKKTGVYNPIDKTVEWELDVNYKEYSLPTAKIVDTFGDKQTMDVVDKNTVKVHLLDMAATPTINSEFTNYTVTGIGTAGNYTGFELDFGETIEKAYRVEYTTEYNEQFIGEFSDQANRAKNTAVFTSEGNKVTDYDTENLSTSPLVTNAGKYFEKNGRDIQNTDYLEWTFKFNESQSHIKEGSTIEDTLNDGQVLVEDFSGDPLNGILPNRDTFQIKEFTYTRSGNDFTKNEAILTATEVDELFNIDIATDKKSFTITLKQDINHEYEISYVTNISASSLTTLSNTYTYNFNGTAKEETKEVELNNVTYEYSGGTGNLRTYNLNLTKIDGNTNDALEGVKFGLYLGTNLSKEAVTDSTGKLSFGEIKYGTYTLKELTPYDATYSTEFQVVGEDTFNDEYTFTTSGLDSSITINAINKKTCPNFTLTVKYNGNPVQAGVDVVIKDDAGTTQVTTGTTNADGQIEFEETDLPKGDYKVYDTNGIELGDITVLYLMGDCEDEVTFAGDQSCPIFTLTVNQNGIAVGENMKITLKHATDPTQSPITANTNADGKIEYDKTDLPVGKYQVFNHKDEHLGNITVHENILCEDVVDIALNNVCPVFTLTLQDRNGTARPNVDITVRDASRDVVEDANGNSIVTTDANGVVTFHYVIEPGTYTVYEVDTNGTEKLINSFTVTTDCEAEVKPSTGGGGGWIPPAPSCDVFTVTVKQQGTIVGADVEITLKSGTTEVNGTTDANGNIKFNKADLSEGTYTAYDKDGKEVGTIVVSYDEEKCQDEIDLLVKSCETFTITVKESGEVVDAGTSLTLKDASGNTVATGTTDTDGKISFDKVDLPEGSYKAFDNAGKEIAEITVSYDEGKCQAVVDILLKACEHYKLTVVDTPNTFVEVKDKDGNIIVTGTTDANGNVTFTQSIPEGNYEVYIEGEKAGNISVTDSCEGTITPEVEIDPEKPDPENPDDDEDDPNGDNGESNGGGGNTDNGTDSGTNPPAGDGNGTGTGGNGSNNNGNASPPGSTNGDKSDSGINKTGKLPQTGEEHYMYMIALGTLLLAAGAFVLYRPRRKA